MPEAATVKRARKKLQGGRSPSTAAGEFVREEIHHVREGKHGARSAKQAIAIGLSKARRAGVPLQPPRRGASRRTRKAATRALAAGQRRRKPRGASRTRKQAAARALRREPRRAASHRALAGQAHRSAKRRGRKARVAAARKAVRTKGRASRRRAAKKAATTRRRAT
ncbi:MAG TPA: DUF6496 domain-containing protein [Vicinamibacterales bacterium]|nr:DUF6496 domain-containing protein [Vicinamibacterales bacterium]